MKTAVITGGTRGLGLELAKSFKKRGFNVMICGTNQANIDKALDAVRTAVGDGTVSGMVCNVSVRSEVEALAAKVAAKFGSVDIWINNAGVNQSYSYAWEISEEETEFLLNVDLKGTVNGCVTALKMMTRQGHGAIYNVEGMGSNDAFQPRFALYGTAKRAVTYYTDAISKEIQEENLPVIIGKLSPGIMITDFLTSSNNKQGANQLSDILKKVYNILGDYPDVISEFLTDRIISNTRNGIRINWLTNRKAAFRFMTAGFNKRDFFS